MKKQYGLTIVELLIVIVVIGILAAIAIAVYGSIQQRARDSRRTSDIGQIQTALGLYQAENSAYPSVGVADQGYSVGLLATPLAPYLVVVPNDPVSGVQYSYVTNSAGSAYGLYIRYEAKPPCKILVNTTTGYWGATVPIC